MTDNSFFNESSEQSKVKTAIVTKYFEKWAQIVMNTQDRYPHHGNKIAYLDLFAGPGRFEDGTKSTPLLILEKALQNDKLRGRLVTLFNDKDEDNTDSLQNAINALPGIETLNYAPEVQKNEVGSEMVKLFEEHKLVPTLFFVDPWGYKGLSLRLINTVVKDWGCDCIFFFNYNRINMGVGNDVVEEHIDQLFGKERADILRSKLTSLSPHERELMIVEEICQAIRDMGRPYVLPFGFKNENGKRTMHHLIFVSKHPKGYTEMKEVMAAESSEKNEGVASFEYSPATERQPFLFELSRLDDLEGMLLTYFAGRTITMLNIYEEHNVDRPYIRKNYKAALSNLHDKGLDTIEQEKRKFWRQCISDVSGETIKWRPILKSNGRITPSILGGVALRCRMAANFVMPKHYLIAMVMLCGEKVSLDVLSVKHIGSNP